jgi:hypothetical protein
MSAVEQRPVLGAAVPAPGRNQEETNTIAKMKVALAAVLVVASASTALAAKRKPVHHAPATLSEGRNAAPLAPFTAGEQQQFERASRPSNL